MKTQIASYAGSRLKGSLKLSGFILLCLLSIPVHILILISHMFPRTAFPRFFHKILGKLVGLRIRVHGKSVKLTGEKGPVLHVSNHASYLDIIALGGVIPASFVAKSEVASWPFIGFMARLQNTVFVERRSVRARTQTNILRDRLEEGESLILFPEGTSTEGHYVLPFKSSLFSIVEKPLKDGSYPLVQPVSIIATEISGLPIQREWRPYYAWFGDMTLAGHVWEFFKIGNFTVDIVFHPPVSMEKFKSRKEMAVHCQKLVAKGVNQGVRGRFSQKTCAKPQ